MQSSNRVIKNEDVSYSDNAVTISNIKIKMPSVEKKIVDETNDIDNGNKSVNNEILKEQLRNELIVEIEEERKTILDNTINEAKEEINKLQQDAINKGYEEGHIKGHEEGFNQGIAKAYRDCEEQCDTIKRNALNLIEQAKIEVDAYYKESKKEIIILAGQMAESIVHKTIDSSDENLLSLIKPIVEQYEGKENIILTCHPDSTNFLKDNIKSIEELYPEGRFIVLEDSNLEKNGCTIENESQIIDLQIGKQIHSIIEDLKNMED